MLDIPGRIINKLRRYWHFRPILAAAEKNTKTLLVSGKHQRILVLCYGNIYRSPFVERYLNRKLQASTFEIRSAGTYPKPDRPSPEKHITMSQELFGINLAAHRSVVADEELLDWADIIVIMDKHNWAELERYGDNVLKKIVWLGSLSSTGVEINDPYGRDETETLAILNRLQYCTDRLIEYLDVT